MSGARPAAAAWGAPAGLALCLLAVYLATFNGRFRSVDELALYAQTASLAQSGQLTPDLVRFAAFHNPVGPFEPGYALLAAPLYALARLWPGVSNLHAVLLLNPLLTAATGALVFRLTRQLGYSLAASLGAGLAFGLGSLAWPYTKSFLREPAVGLLWTLSLYGLALFDARPTRGHAILVLAPALAAAAVKVSSIAFWPVAALGLAFTLRRQDRLSRYGLWAAGGLAAGAALIFGLWLLPQRGYPVAWLLSSLFANPFTAEGFLPWYGLLASPGKSLFLYSPVLALAGLGWPRAYRRHPGLTLAGLLLLIVMLASLRSSQWWGGLAWGPRFLLPLLPALIWPVAATLERWRWAWVGVAASMLLQALVTSTDWTRAYAAAFKASPFSDLTIGLDWSRWAETPLFVLLANWGPAALDLAWLFPDANGVLRFDGWLAAGLLAGGLSASGALAVTLCAAGRSRRRALVVASGLIALIVPGLLWRAQRQLPDYPGLSAETARALAAELNAGPYQPRQVVNVAADLFVYPWLGLLKGPASQAWISPLDPAGASLWSAAAGAGPLAVVVDWPHLWGHAPDAQLREFNRRGYRFANVWLDGYEVIYYAAGPIAAEPARAAAAAWPVGARLTAWRAPAVSAPGAALPLELTFECATAPCPVEANVFVSLLGPAAYAGQNGPVQYGGAEWRVGETLTDRRAIWIPAEAPAGEYTLVTGWIGPPGVIPAQVAGGATVEHVILGVVTIRR